MRMTTRVGTSSNRDAFQEYFYRDTSLDSQDNAAAAKLVAPPHQKEKKLSPRSHNNNHHHHVTNSNPKANFSVLVNNPNHYRFSLSPKTRIRSHHVGHKNGIRVSSPLHKARLWKNQNSGSSSIPSTESNTPTSKADEDDDDLDER
jgi:hypothetical protein